jgi:putative transposase
MSRISPLARWLRSPNKFVAQRYFLQVSRVAALLDEVLSTWCTRPFGEVVYQYLYARYERIRVDGQIRDAVLLMASGVQKNGKWKVLEVSVSLSEAGAHWWMFLKTWSIAAYGACG